VFITESLKFLNPEIPVGPLFVDHLANYGKLENATFSFALNDFSEGNSHIDFGNEFSGRLSGLDFN
jgi:hypothetical protein